MRTPVRSIIVVALFVVFLSTFYLLLSTSLHAQESLTLTVTPPLFQVNLNPGESWASTIRVVNGNPYPVSLYADPVSFVPDGEAGRPKFDLKNLAPGSETQKEGLASWIRTLDGPLTAVGEQTVEVPLFISVPKDAPPGGHYAAVLIGNRAPEKGGEGGTVSVASSIASLILLTVSGDVVEKARIRDFVAERSLYETPEAHFSLRFENQGNVHLQPQGAITIYNMFGKQRGYLPINQGSYFGNVLPGSIRKFSFSWKADSGRWDIGRYRAEATLGYGKDAKQFAASTAYFYVLPIVPMLQVGGALIAFILFIVWGIRAYVRKALMLEATRLGYGGRHHALELPLELGGAQPIPQQAPVLRTLARPLQAGMVDLRRATRGENQPEVVQQASAAHAPLVPLTMAGLVVKYRYFILFVLVLAITWFVLGAFVEDVLVYERTYEVEVEETEFETTQGD